MEVETEAQALFELYGGMAKGFTPRLINRENPPRWGLFATHDCGLWTNMSYRRSVFGQIGTFDTALDVGTPSAGAGDLDMFYRVLSAGFGIQYEPAAMVRHSHRRTLTALRKQIYSNGQAYGVLIVKAIIREESKHRREALHFARKWLLGWVIRRLVSRKVRRQGFPTTLLWADFCGVMNAPRAYFATYAHDRKVRRSQPDTFSQD
jgi:hypothetical protein